MSRRNGSTTRWWAFAACWLLLSCERAPSAPQELRIYAASSLTEAFDELALAFERAHPAVSVSQAYAGSQVLRLQIEQGAPADVFASANAEHVQALVRAGDAVSPTAFASNELVVVLPEDASPEVRSFEQIATLSRIVLGAPTVPVGAYADRLLERARKTIGDDFVAEVRRRVASRESNVRLVRAKVEMGEADAALVYRTDAIGSPRLRIVELPAELRTGVRYHVAPLARSDVPTLAAEWVSWLRGAVGREVLARHGFVPGVEEAP